MAALDYLEKISFWKKWVSENKLGKVSDDDAAAVTYMLLGTLKDAYFGKENTKAAKNC